MDGAQHKFKQESESRSPTSGRLVTNTHPLTQIPSSMPSHPGEPHVNRAGSDSPISQHEGTHSQTFENVCFIPQPLHESGQSDSEVQKGALSDHSGPPGPNASKTNNVSSAANGGSPLNPRSCVTCRKRKVRCDKRHPCINCTKAGIECIFPGPGRAPRRSRKPPDSELLARLRKLEGVVKDLGKEVELEEEGGSDGKTRKPIIVNGTLAEKDPGCNTSQFFNHLDQKDDDKGTAKMVKNFGRLVVEEGRSRYVSNKFWTSLSEEVQLHLKEALVTASTNAFGCIGSGNARYT